MKHYRQEHYRQELTLHNALADPLVRTMMAADSVDPQELSAMLHDIVATLDRAQLQPRYRGSLPATNCGRESFPYAWRPTPHATHAPDDSPPPE